MANSIVYDAAEHGVHSVTVFQVNNAEVTRRIELDLKKGQNEVLIKNLPSVLDGDSVRVDGIGKAIVFDVVYKAPANNSYGVVRTAGAKKESEEIEEQLKKKASLGRERDVVDKQRTILESYSETITSEFAKSDALSDFLQTYGSRQLEFATKLHDIDEQICQVDEKIKELREAQGKLAGDSKRGSRIVVVVLAEEDGPAELSLAYNVSGASWTPVYDVRAEIASSNSDSASKSDSDTKSKITLDYRASITQRTAEDWSDVHLTLSTASPQLGSAIPTLSAIRLGERPSAPMYAPKKAKRVSLAGGGGPARHAMALNLNTYDPTIIELDRAGPIPPPTAPEFMAYGSARVTNAGGGFTSAFVVDGLSNIPSDTDDSSESHKVTISIVHLKNVDLEWVAVPKQNQSVFLKARVKNTTEFTFLAGAASIFMNNNFVAKSSIPRVSPNESFAVSLGVDSSVRVIYHPQSKKVNVPTGGFMTTARISTAYHQRISVKNTRSLPLTKLIVKDQVPTSTNEQIKVNVFEPALPELQASGKGSSNAQSKPTSGKEIVVNGYKDVRARWARVNDDDDDSASNDALNVTGLDGEVNTEGFMEWICRVDANSSLDLKLGWEVSVPKGFAVQQL